MTRYFFDEIQILDMFTLLYLACQFYYRFVGLIPKKMKQKIIKIMLLCVKIKLLAAINTKGTALVLCLKKYYLNFI